LTINTSSTATSSIPLCPPLLSTSTLTVHGTVGRAPPLQISTPAHHPPTLVVMACPTLGRHAMMAICIPEMAAPHIVSNRMTGHAAAHRSPLAHRSAHPCIHTTLA
jgi:hypothetical protein